MLKQQIKSSPVATAVGQWGRASEANFISVLGSFAILTCSPILALYFYVVAFHFDCSLTAPLLGLYHGSLTFISLWQMLPAFSWTAVYMIGTWITFQVLLACIPDLLHYILPGYRGGVLFGAVTPAGNRLLYNINGLQAWLISQVLFITGAYYVQWFSPTIIFDNWGSFLWVANIIGYSLAIYAYFKAHYSPTIAEERKFSGNFFYDFFMGIELNPRIGPIDFKLFFNGRPGIVAWTLINFSFAAAQYHTYGAVTNSMLLVNLLQGLYVIYFFWKEAWYLNTIDIHHDHFGWMLAWGDSVWLPYMYTLQALFLVFHPVELSMFNALFVLGIGLVGFWIFVSSNNQKDRFRHSNGHAKIWNKKSEFIACQYTTKDGEVRQTKLLTSGWWGITRHMNYTGDLLLSLAYSMACGFSYAFPYFYFVFLFVLLLHRCIRDEDRCAKKYGIYWKQYCEKVPHRLIPGIF